MSEEEIMKRRSPQISWKAYTVDEDILKQETESCAAKMA
jgi:hypothetical protein